MQIKNSPSKMKWSRWGWNGKPQRAGPLCRPVS